MSDSNRCLIHFHIPRTGGTTVRHLLVPRLLERFPADAIYLIDTGPEYGCRSGSYRDFAALSARERSRIRFVSGHVPVAIADLVPAPLMFTVVRDPLERALSDYWHCFHATDNAAHAMARRLSPAAFVDGGFGQARNGHARYLSDVAFTCEQVDDDELFVRASSGLKRMSYVGRYENLKGTVADICALAGVAPVKELLHLQRATRLEPTPADQLARIADCNRVDELLVARRDDTARVLAQLRAIARSADRQAAPQPFRDFSAGSRSRR